MHKHPQSNVTLFILIAAQAFVPVAIAQGGRGGGGGRGAARELPMTVDRNMEFTTDEGTWISLDVSPDGATILFDLLGRLYTLPAKGGAATAITQGFAYDREPRFSPDGKHFAFVSDRSGEDNLWIANADGSGARAITTDENALFVSPSWSPDGKAIYVSKKKPHFFSSAYELWRYEVAGGAGATVLKGAEGGGGGRGGGGGARNAALGVIAAPDGSYVFFARRGAGGGGGGSRLAAWQIVRHDLITGEDDPITAIEGGGFRPLLSPDGKQLIYGTRFESRTALRIRDLTSGEERWLKWPIERDDQESAIAADVLPGYAFFPGGHEIALYNGGKIHRLNIQTGTDSVIPFEAKVTRELGAKLNFPTRVEEGPVHARLIQSTSFSADGKRLAFSALAHVYVAGVESGAPQKLIKADGNQYEPVWSPDGQWIAYASWSNADGAIWRTRADGSGSPERLTKAPAHYEHLAWTPDSKRIVAVRTSLHQALSQESEWGRELSTSDLVWIPSTGGTQTVVATGDGFRYPHFTDDPDRIFLTVIAIPTLLAPTGTLESMRWDGSDRRVYMRVRGRDVWGAEVSPIMQILASPDEKRALILYRNQAYVSSLPMPNGEVPTVNVSAPADEVARLTTIGADEVSWVDHGKIIAWTAGSSLFTLTTAEIEAGEQPERRNTYAWAKQLKPREKAFDIEAPRHKPEGTIVLRGARVITMHGDDVLSSADIVIKDNRIVSVGPKSSATPAGAHIVDVTGRTIVPGFVDTHAHWFEIRRGVLDLQNWDFLADLAYGITTGRDPQTGTTDTFAYQDLVDTGDILGPRAYSTGPGVFYVTDIQTLDEAMDIVTRYKKYYRTNMLKAYMSGGRRTRELIAEACKRLQVMPTTEGAADLALDMTHFIDGFSNEHQFPIDPIYKDVAELVAQSGGFYTPTYIISSYDGPATENYFYQTTGVYKDPKVKRFIPYDIIESKASRNMWASPDEYAYPIAAEGNERIIKAGGKICVGGHGEFQGSSFHWELWSLRSEPVTSMQALRAATLNGAEALGLAQDLGSIEPGKLADLVILRKNPLEDIHNTMDIEYVMKNGELFQGDTLDEVWPVKKPLAPLWWWTDRPDAAK